MIFINSADKPKRSAEYLVEMLKTNKGISFDKYSENDAINYFKNINNYLRTASYRKNFDKYLAGTNKGKYIRLDFAYLVDISTIDMHLRNVLLKMCINLEHDLKTQFISAVESDPDENGYNIVKLFLENNESVLVSIQSKADSVFTGDLIRKYFGVCTVIEDAIDPKTNCNYCSTRIMNVDCPVWVLVEIISFGELIKLIEFYNDLHPNSKLQIPPKNILKPVCSLRNACAHNNCILNNMRPSNTQPPKEISRYVSLVPGIGKEERIKKLSCRPIFEIVCLIKSYDTIVSPNVKRHDYEDLKNVIRVRMRRNIGYYEETGLVKTSFDFLLKIIDNLQ